MQSFERDGLRFDVRDHAPDGDPLDPPVAVLLHGYPQDATAYDAVVPLLTAGGMRVLAPDQRGYSPGARPRGRRAYALAELVADVVALLDRAGVTQGHVVGHDWGGSVAWALAGRHPERTASLTALSTPHPAAMAAGLRHADQAWRSRYMLWYQVPRLPERVLTADDGARMRAVLAASGLEPARVEHYARRLVEPGALAAAIAWYRALPWTARYRVGRVRVPVTFVHGTRDRFFAERSVLATERFVLGPFRRVALDADHWLPEHRPQDVADAVLAHARG